MAAARLQLVDKVLKLRIPTRYDIELLEVA